jgi:uncharacterized protein (UPF0303 family)
MYGRAVTDDIERVREQQRLLVLRSFDEDAAWALGAELRRRARDRGVAVTIEVRLRGDTVFLCSMRGTAPANADWARCKRNTVELLHRPSYLIGLEAARSGRSELDVMGLDPRHHADHGGSFPIAVDGVGVVGAVTVSGLPQRADHELVVEGLAGLAGVDLASVRLDR